MNFRAHFTFLDSGEYFIKEKERRKKKKQEKAEKQEAAEAERKKRRLDLLVAPKVKFRSELRSNFLK